MALTTQQKDRIKVNKELAQDKMHRKELVRVSNEFHALNEKEKKVFDMLLDSDKFEELCNIYEFNLQICKDILCERRQVKERKLFGVSRNPYTLSDKEYNGTLLKELNNKQINKKQINKKQINKKQINKKSMKKKGRNISFMKKW